MKKVLTKLILVLLLITAAACAFCWFRADAVYRNATAELPAEQAAEAYMQKEVFLPFEEIDPDFVNAAVAVEDKRFFERKGYDFIALGRAIYNNLRYGELREGGSTIPEQIAKNLYFGPKHRDIWEKLAGVRILYDLEEAYTPEELFALYANMNYYGDGYYGLQNAAEGYYGTSASELSLAKAAMLAGLPNAPSAYQLSTGFAYAKKRQEKVLRCMLKNEYITEKQLEEALAEDVSPAPKG
ncbi:MAG: transglycosylase domain-containing protein [Solobacterium sp.]|nr:transglycosylase domain-containing protein [Solobacterium sp.]